MSKEKNIRLNIISDEIQEKIKNNNLIISQVKTLIRRWNHNDLKESTIWGYVLLVPFSALLLYANMVEGSIFVIVYTLFRICQYVYYIYRGKI